MFFFLLPHKSLIGARGRLLCPEMRYTFELHFWLAVALVSFSSQKDPKSVLAKSRVVSGPFLVRPPVIPLSMWLQTRVDHWEKSIWSIRVDCKNRPK